MLGACGGLTFAGCQLYHYTTQATLSLPSLSRTGWVENKMEKHLWIKGVLWSKSKGHMQKQIKIFIVYFPSAGDVQEVGVQYA